MNYYKLENGKAVSSVAEIKSKSHKKITKSEYGRLIRLNAKIDKLKAELSKSDYKAIKFAEGLIPADEYDAIKAERQKIRAEINELESKL